MTGKPKDPDYHKKYYQKNRVKILTYQKEYNKTHLKKWVDRTEYHKRYNEKNAELIKKKARIMGKLKRDGILQFLPKWRVKQIVEIKLNEPC